MNASVAIVARVVDTSAITHPGAARATVLSALESASGGRGFAEPWRDLGERADESPALGTAGGPPPHGRNEGSGVAVPIRTRIEFGEAIREPVASPRRPALGWGEFAADAPRLSDALATTLAAHLLLPDGMVLRFGIGVSLAPASWKAGTAARGAIENIELLANAGHDYARTWCEDADEEEPDLLSAVNALLLARDHMIGRMKARDRRIAAAALRGETTAEIAVSQGQTEEFVERSLRRSGGLALVEAQSLIESAVS